MMRVQTDLCWLSSAGTQPPALAVSLLVLALGGLLSGAALADSRLQPNQSLTGTMVAGGGRYRLVMQSDCNLVEYDSATVLWRSGTQGRGTGCAATMNADGELVVANGLNQVIFATGSRRPGVGAYLDLQDDGNVVIYDPAPLTPLWARTRLLSGGYALIGANSDFIHSLNGQYTLTMQNDCNLVFYRGASAIWASQTNGRGVNCAASLSSKGHLQVTNGAGVALWTSTGPDSLEPAGAYLDVQDDGNLVLYAGAAAVPPTGKPLWASVQLPPPPPPPPPAPVITAGIRIQADQSYLLVVGGSGFEASESASIAVYYRPSPDQPFGALGPNSVMASTVGQIGLQVAVVCQSDSPNPSPQWQVTATGLASHRTSNTAQTQCF